MPTQPIPTQNYSNHVRQVPAFLSVFLILFLTLIGAAVNLYNSFGDHQRLYSASLIFVLSACLLPILLWTRGNALKAQDRAIRAEENLRHFVLTGKLLDPRLTVQQIAAVRFASDAEFPELASRAAAGNLPAKEIKQTVKQWRADFDRV